MSVSNTSTPATTAPANVSAQPASAANPSPEPIANVTPAQAAAVARMMKLKIDGQDLEMPESEVIALAQQGKSANKRFQEAALAKRQAEELVSYMKSNPKEVLQKLGIDVRKLSEDTLMEIINQEKMSPEQRKASENETKLKKYEADEKARVDKDRNDKMAALEQTQMQNYDQTFVKALAETGLPKTAYTVKRMAELTLVAVKKGLDLDATQLAKIVKEDYENEHKMLYGQSDGETLLRILGKEGVKKLSKAQLAQYKTSAKRTPPPVADSRKPKEPVTDSRVTSWKEFQKANRRLS